MRSEARPALLVQTEVASPFDQIKETLRELYLADERPWLVGFSGGKDSTMVASLIFDTVFASNRHCERNPSLWFTRSSYSFSPVAYRHNCIDTFTKTKKEYCLHFQ